MHAFLATLTRSLVVAISLRSRQRATERGDVPGWVMVTVMTAGLVAALWAIAGPELARMLRDALNSVS